ncbi:MAG TPA: tRNA lysidine(34) synthetase TilS [Pyrinomonadaceae bacterium]|nr:tRNA lysidine(34) synthetase TilS [Pyrinomonadaceae bacterium]
MREWRVLALGDSGEPIVVAVSGGADSVAMWLALEELVQAKKLNAEIIVAHLNHKLRAAASDADANWVRKLAKKLGHKPVVGNIDIVTCAGKSKDNLEQAARRARYDFLAVTAKACKSHLVLTAHTMNDQAETIVLNLIRGSGSDGLSGIDAIRQLLPASEIILARPLLSWARRQDTESYCLSRLINYREDAMNSDLAFARVRVRRKLLPSLEEFNPKFVETVARTAEILREDGAALDLAAEGLVDESMEPGGPLRSLPSDLLSAAPVAIRRRALRLWLARHRGDLRRIERAHIIAIETLLLSPKSGRTVQLPGGATVARRNGRLHYRSPQ